MKQKDIQNAVHQVRSDKKITGETIIDKFHTYDGGWQYYGKCVRDFVNDANKNPRFFNKVDALMIGEEEYEFQSVLFEWDIIGLSEFGPAVEGYAWHTHQYGLDGEFESDSIEEMRKNVKEICKQHGWAFLDGDGPVEELKKAYRELAKEQRGEI